MPTKKLLLAILLAALFSLTLAIPAFAMEGHDCTHVATIDSLREHASMTDHVDNQGVANSLVAKLDAADAALDRGQPDVAANLLNAFINQVQAQSGKHIHADHAGCLINHAGEVIDNLS